MYHSQTEFEQVLSSADLSNEIGSAIGEWCIEMLGKDGWAPLRTGFFRSPARYGTYEEAVEASVRAWRTHDKATRPRRIA